MSNYYVIIGGQRYDASLVKSARTKVSGAGDGRISKKEALELWLIAMDGGRITEIEETTFEYLQKTLNWTAPAKKWLKEALSLELNKTKSFYKIIDGLRYDRKLLEAAEKLTTHKKGNRISFTDAKMLFPIINDAGGLSIEEERSLDYLLKNYRWTKKAEKWMLAKVWFFEKENPFYKGTNLRLFLVQHVLDNYFRFENFKRNYIKFTTFEFAYIESEARQQMLGYDNKVALNLALWRALDSLMGDTSPTSLKSISTYSHDSVAELLEHTRLVLLPGDMSSEPALSSFPSPNRGESIRDNWIFGLDLFDLSDDIYWVIVPRDGKSPAYNYMGGSNVGDIYHINEMDQFFTISVQSDETPSPDIMIEVQDPNGKFILTKSDAEGKAFITGPPGKYTIHATATGSQLSESFEWDAKGNSSILLLLMDS